MHKSPALILVLLLACTGVRAQFNTLGSDPAGVEWATMWTPTYKLIYPAGMDSLAGAFALSLEKFRPVLKATSGYAPNEMFETSMPVIIHPYTSYNNGMVSWAPRRMTLLAVPDAYDPESTQWVDYLSVHEGRHVSQMQFVRGDATFKTLGKVVGELWAGAAAALYPGTAFFEGDAVVAETALTPAGRGRSSDFLEYYRVSFADMEYRNYWRWRYSSIKDYTPDYYRAGYMLIAGMRTSFDRPDFVPYYYGRIFRSAHYPFKNLQKSVKELSGMEFDDAFRKIEDDFAAEWAANDALRAPFMSAHRLTPSPRRYEKLSSLVFAGDSLLALRNGLEKTDELVLVGTDGRQKRLFSFSQITSRLARSPLSGRIYWTEYKQDPRWPLRSYSELRYLDPRGKKVSLSKKVRYYNPSPSPADSLVAVTVYNESSTSAVALIDETWGFETERWEAPSELQVVETAWTDDELYASAISEEGFGIYRVDDWYCILKPCQAKINRMFGQDGRIWFTSDRDGTSELYSLTTEGELWKETSLRFGGNDWAFHGDSLYFTAPSLDARGIYAVAVDSLLGEEGLLEPYPHPIADKLSSQEPEQPSDNPSFILSDPQPYSKLANLFKLHSWAPLYIEYDAVSGISYETTSTPSFLGATGWFQNDLENFYGSAGLSLEPQWTSSAIRDSVLTLRPAFHAQFVYDGWYPVIEFRADVNRREAWSQSFSLNPNGKSYSPHKDKLSKPQVLLSLNAYIPWILSSGGWSRGLIPEARITWGNDSFQTLTREAASKFEEVPPSPSYDALVTRIGIRGYTMLQKAPAGIFPRWGIGAELSMVDMPLIRQTYGGTVYGMVYGYLPGLLPTHGLKLSATASQGFGSVWSKGSGIKWSAEYAMPFAPVDWTFLCPAFYIRNFEFRAYASYDYEVTEAISTGISSSMNERLVGASLSACLGNFLWVPFDTRVGVKYMYNILVPSMSAVSAIFSVDI